MLSVGAALLGSASIAANVRVESWPYENSESRRALYTARVIKRNARPDHMWSGSCQTADARRTSLLVLVVPRADVALAYLLPLNSFKRERATCFTVSTANGRIL